MFGRKRDNYSKVARDQAPKDPGNTEKVRIRLFDSYGNKESVNVRVAQKANFLEDAKKKIEGLFRV